MACLLSSCEGPLSAWTWPSTPYALGRAGAGRAQGKAALPVGTACVLRPPGRPACDGAGEPCGVVSWGPAAARACGGHDGGGRCDSGAGAAQRASLGPASMQKLSELGLFVLESLTCP